MDKFYYVNCENEKIDLRSDKIVSSYEALKNYTVSMNNNRLMCEEKVVSLHAVCMDIDTANKLVDILDKDCSAGLFGRLYINDWFIMAFYQGFKIITRASEKIKLELSFLISDTIFTKESKYILYNSENITSGNGIKFPFTYPLNFGVDKLSSSEIENLETLDADFVCSFTASAESVELFIDANCYRINAPISDGETFVLNTFEKEVYKLTEQGKVSMFGAADDSSYVFEPIKKGKHKITWNGAFPINLSILEHRRTPLWI